MNVRGGGEGGGGRGVELRMKNAIFIDVQFANRCSPTQLAYNIWTYKSL